MASIYDSTAVTIELPKGITIRVDNVTHSGKIDIRLTTYGTLQIQVWSSFTK